MGAFDDLVPPQGAAAGLFDDLIPPAAQQSPPGFDFGAKNPAQGAFDDLIPEDGPESPLARVLREMPGLSLQEARKVALSRMQNVVQSEADVTASDVAGQTFNMFPSRLLQVVPDTLKTAGGLGTRLSAWWNNAEPTAEDLQRDPLTRAGQVVEQAIGQTYPTPADPTVGENVLGGIGQVAGMIVPGKALGLGVKGATNLALAGGGVQEFQDAFQRAQARGDDPDTAFAKALGYASVATLIENRLGVGRLLRQYMPAPDEAAKVLTGLGVSRALLGNFIAGGVEEGTQRLAQNWIVEGEPSTEGVLEEAIPGALVQGLIGAPATVAPLGQQQQEAQAWNAALLDSGRRAALEASVPQGAAVVRETPQPVEQSAAVGLFDDLIPSESQTTESPSASDQLGLVPNGAGGRTGEATAIPAAPPATRPDPAQVRQELEALPGAEEERRAEGGEQPAELTPEERAQPLTRGDLVDEVKKLAAALEANRLKPQEQARGETTTNISAPAGVASPGGAPAGAVAGVRAVDPLVAAQPVAAGEATPALKPKPWQPTNGQPVVYVHNARSPGKLATVVQAQPDGSATVLVKGEKGYRTATAAQLRPTNAENSRRLRAAELAEAGDPDQVQRDAKEFAVLVEEYAPQLGVMDAQAFDDAVLRGDSIANERLRQRAREAMARAAGVGSYQDNMPTERARALPLLEAYLKQQFPGDNSIAKRRTLEEFGRSEANPEQTATVERDQAVLDQLAASRPNQPYFRGLRAVGRSVSRGQNRLRQPGARAGVLSSAGASTVTELERIFGVRIIFVADAPFNGVRVQGQNLILINADSKRATLAIAGHELMHHIKAIHPGLYADFVAQARSLLKNNEQFRAELAAKGYPNITEAVVEEEMFADVLGDAAIDPVFLQQLAKSEPNLFKRFARTAVKWLEKLIAKAKALGGFDSAQYVTDLTEMRQQLLNLLRDAGRQTQFERAGIEADAVESTEQGQDAFSKRTIDRPASAAIRDKDTGEIWYGQPTHGLLHDQIPNIKQRNLEAGFATKGGKFITQNEAERIAGIASGEELFDMDADEVKDVFTSRREVTAYDPDLTPEQRAERIKELVANEKKAMAFKAAQGGDRFSMEGGDLFGAPESVEEQRARMEGERVQSLKSKAQSQMQERAGARLIGKDLDTTQEMFGAEVKRDKSGQQDMFSLEAGPVWRSNIQGALASWQGKGTPQQLLAHLQKTRGAMDEAEWIGLTEFLKDKPSVTKQQVADFVKANTVDVQEVTKGENHQRRILENEWNDLKRKAQEKYGAGDRYYYNEDFIGSPERNRMREIETATQEMARSEDGKPKFANYQLPGGENYRELLLTLPDAGSPIEQPQLRQSDDGLWYAYQSGKKLFGGWDTKEQGEKASGYKAFAGAKTQFKSSHFDEPNILAHVRFNERTDADGQRVLFIEEVQSDWHQKGRKEGYTPTASEIADARKEHGETLAKIEKARRPLLKTTLPDGYSVVENPRVEGRYARFGIADPVGKIIVTGQTRENAIRNGVKTINANATSPEIEAMHDRLNKLAGIINGEGVPNAPFKQTWPMLAMKRMIRYAADNGFDRIAWTTGEQQAERYDLSKQVDQIAYYPNDDGTVKIQVAKNGSVVMSENSVTASRAEDMVGKEIAKKIFDGEGKEYGEGKVLSGLDLKVGGEGMKGFYDRILPSEVNKFVKKWGGRVGRAAIVTGKGGEQIPDGAGGLVRTGSGAEQVHSLDITPSMKAAALEGFDMFSLPDPAKQSEFTKLQEEIGAAEQALRVAIRQHMNPPPGMRKAEALEAKNEAGRKLRHLLAQQLNVMTDPRSLDAARSPEETAQLISQTVDMLNSVQDEISAATVRAEAVPPDLLKLRTDLQERLNRLKGWADDQSDELRATKVETAPRRDERFTALEAATDPQHKTLGEWWQTIKNGLRYLTSPIPELPLTGERAEKSALFRRGYRLFAVENNRVRKEAAERVNTVLEPLTKLGRTPASNEALRRYYKLGEARERAAMDETKRKAIAAQMVRLEETALNKDPFNLFRRLVLYKDLRWRATYLKNDAGKPITLPLGLTVDEVGAELRRTYALIEKHPDGLAITEALRRHYQLTDDLQKSILEHGEIIPESLRNPLYFPHHVIDSWSGNIARVRPSTEEDFRKYLIAPTGSAQLIQTDYLKAMYLHTADVLAHNARVDLVEKYWKPYDISEQLKAQHGDKWNLPWNIPPGYKLFTPFNKLPLRMDYVLSREVLADKLGVLFNDGDLRERLGDTGRVLKVKPEDLHAALVAGEKIQWVLPAEIAEALNWIVKREKVNPVAEAIGLPFVKVNNFWKKTKLFAPWNWIRYEYGNLSTDAIDKVLAADPGAAKYLARAAREVWTADTGEQSPEYQAAAREGVFDTITAGEAGELTKLPEFKAFLTGGEARWDKVRSFLERPMRGSKFREATFRYAKFLADVERLRAGKEPTYAGAFHGDIEALGEDVDGQRRMLEGDELIYAKAAEISLKTYGDYNSLSVASQIARKYLVPFWSWQDVNFRYHANQLRNLADGLLTKSGPELNTARKAALRYAGVRVVTTLVAIGIAKELWNQFGGPAMGLWDDDDDLESKLSEADRRRGHLIVGKDKDGKVLVVYTPSAWSDVAEWMGGQNMKRLFMEYARGQITLDQFVKDYAKQLPKDVANKVGQSGGPLLKAPYELASGKSTFPDVLDQRSIPAADKWWRLVGTLTDDRVVNVLRGVFDQDYYSQPATEQLQQIILQIRRRDPEQWSYYEAREDAADWKEARTGKRFEQGSYDAPEAQALRNFRKAIYRGDVRGAEHFYGRLLQFGYTAERLDASVRNQHPLSDLNAAERTEYLKTLTPKQRQELEMATQYYNRLKALDGREKALFPRKGQPARANPQLLRRIVADQESRNQ